MKPVILQNVKIACCMSISTLLVLFHTLIPVPLYGNCIVDNNKTIVVNGISYTIVDADNRLLKVVRSIDNSYKGDISIPSEVEYNGEIYTVTVIGSKAFYAGIDQNFPKVSITLPNTITVVEDSAFYSINATICNIPDKLEYVGREGFCYSTLPYGIKNLPETLEYIGISGFSGCNLKGIRTLPSKISVVEPYAFSSAKLGSLILGDNITAIKEYAFYASSLRYIYLSSGVSVIGDAAFADNNLEEFSVSKDNEHFASLGSVLFNKDKSKLISYPVSKAEEFYKVPEGVKEIGCYAFKYTKLKDISLPVSLVSINDHAFENSSNIVNLEIPSGVSHIGKYAFGKCFSLENVKLPELDEISDYLFWGCSKLRNIEIPSTVKTINECAFSITGLSDVIVPEGVNSIMNHAFSGGCLKSVTLPSTLEFLGIYAFSGFSFESLYCKATTPPEADYYICTSDVDMYRAVLYVPEGTKELYKSAQGWSGFKNIVEGTPSSVSLSDSDETGFNIVPGGLLVTGKGTKVSVFTLSGSVVCSKNVNGCEMISLCNGAYLLQIGNTICKVVIE